jgi:hypothetical protein
LRHVDSSQAAAVSISGTGKNAIEFFSENSINETRDWVSRGERFGLRLFQVVTSTKSGIPTESSKFLGAMLVGHSSSGRYVRISCLDFDYARDRYCELYEQFTPNTKLTLAVPTNSLWNWKKYCSDAEAFFLERLER